MAKKRAMPKWRPAPAALVDQFARAVADLPNIETRKMFGYPAVFLNGNMFAGLFQDRVVVRLSEDDRGALGKTPGAGQFEPMPGRPMREYLVVPADVVASPAQFRAWLERARAFVATLPAKQKKGGTKAASAKRKR